MFIAGLSIIVRIWKHPKRPTTDKWIKKLWYIYTIEYNVALRKDEVMQFPATWMELEGIMLSEVSQREKDYQCSHSAGGI